MRKRFSDRHLSPGHSPGLCISGVSIRWLHLYSRMEWRTGNYRCPFHFCTMQT